nr:hypothetical protein Iba_chr13cCG11930 [Ipomoea batatas]
MAAVTVDRGAVNSNDRSRRQLGWTSLLASGSTTTSAAHKDDRRWPLLPGDVELGGDRRSRATAGELSGGNGRWIPFQQGISELHGPALSSREQRTALVWFRRYKVTTAVAGACSTAVFDPPPSNDLLLVLASPRDVAAAGLYSLDVEQERREKRMRLVFTDPPTPLPTTARGPPSLSAAPITVTSSPEKEPRTIETATATDCSRRRGRRKGKDRRPVPLALRLRIATGERGATRGSPLLCCPRRRRMVTPEAPIAVVLELH